MGLSWALYRIVLSDRKSFLFNRFYLLLSLVGLALIPFYTYPVEVAPVVESFAPSIESALSSNGVMEPQVTVLSASDIVANPRAKPFSILWIVYGVSTILLLKLLFDIVSLSWLAHKNFYRQKGGINVVSYKANNTPFSFFNNLFVSEDDLKNGLPEAIELHEECHIKHLHSVDRLVSELILLLQWWNPFAHLLIRDLKDNHEYTADAYAIFHTKQSESFVNCLLERSMSADSYGSFQIGFGQSPILKRLRMIKSKANRLSISQAAPLSIIMILLIMSCVGSVGETINLENSYVDVSYKEGALGKSSYPTQVLERMGDKYYSNIPQYRSPTKGLFEKLRSASNYTVFVDGKKIGKKTREQLTYEGIKGYSVEQTNLKNGNLGRFPEDEEPAKNDNDPQFMAKLFTQAGYFNYVDEEMRRQDERNAAMLHELRLEDVLWLSLTKFSKSGGAPQNEKPKKRKPSIEQLDNFRYNYEVFIDGKSRYLHSEDPNEFSYYVEKVSSEKNKSVELLTDERFQHYLDILKNGAYETSNSEG